MQRKATENGLYRIKDSETIIVFSDTSSLPTGQPKLTENGAEVSAEVSLEKILGSERILAAVYDNSSQLVCTKMTDVTESEITS